MSSRFNHGAIVAISDICTGVLVGVAHGVVSVNSIAFVAFTAIESFLILIVIDLATT